MSAPVLSLQGLSVTLHTEAGDRDLVVESTLDVAPGEALGVVGESGSGKSLSVKSVAGILPPGVSASGRIELDGVDLLTLPAKEARALRAARVGMVFQTPRAYLNPLRTIGDFLTEAMVHVAHMPKEEARARAIALLEEVGVPEPRTRLHQRPGQLSGGLLQRVMIAAALATDPDVLLADEITTALDVTTQEEVMALLAELREHRRLAMVFITHDIELARAVCDRIVIMKDGRTLESHPAASIESDAKHEYTHRLLDASRAVATMEQATSRRDSIPLLEVRGLSKTFTVPRPDGIGHTTMQAVRDVGFALHPGQSLGIVGESGSGKSTTARIICGLESASGGSVLVEGEPWDRPARSRASRRARARMVQMVFQDPYQSLDRRLTVRRTLEEAVRVRFRTLPRADVAARVDSLVAQVGLAPELADARPRALSGGQRQRVAIARALAAEPRILVLDEAVSALDVTAQVEVLALLDGIRRETGVALLMISHDLGVVRRLCDHVVVMRAGEAVEQGEIASVLDSPTHEYTRALLQSVPREGWTPRRKLSPVSGDAASR